MDDKLEPLTAIIKKLSLPFSATHVNDALISMGVIQLVEYESTSGKGVKSYKAIAPQYLHLGENVPTRHAIKTDCRFYSGSVSELAVLIHGAVNHRIDTFAQEKPVRMYELLKVNKLPFGEAVINKLFEGAGVLVSKGDGSSGLALSSLYLDYGENSEHGYLFYPSRFKELVKLSVDKAFGQIITNDNGL